MTLDETIAFLEPDEKRGGAICLSAYDYSRVKTALEQACKQSGKCKYEGAPK